MPSGPEPPRAAPSTPPRRGGAMGNLLSRLPKGDLKSVIAVGSGKGGVGKSTVTALLAAELHREGASVGVLDADVTGPSIPKLLGLSTHLVDRGEGIEPAVTPEGIRTVSSQFLVEDSTTPVIWRGPLVTRLIVQFFGGVNWGPLDFLLIDMPPGTSDVPLTVFQTIPIDGMLFVTTPQDLAGLIVKKAINMARELHVPLLGIVENMARARCPHCQKEFSLYGESHTASMAQEYDIPVLGELTVDPQISVRGDAGTLGTFESPEVVRLAHDLRKSLEDARAKSLPLL